VATARDKAVDLGLGDGLRDRQPRIQRVIGRPHRRPFVASRPRSLPAWQLAAGARLFVPRRRAHERHERTSICSKTWRRRPHGETRARARDAEGGREWPRPRRARPWRLWLHAHRYGNPRPRRSDPGAYRPLPRSSIARRLLRDAARRRHGPPRGAVVPGCGRARRGRPAELRAWIEAVPAARRSSYRCVLRTLSSSRCDPRRARAGDPGLCGRDAVSFAPRRSPLSAAAAPPPRASTRGS